jgi:hypothetical protein
LVVSFVNQTKILLLKFKELTIYENTDDDVGDGLEQ